MVELVSVVDREYDTFSIYGLTFCPGPGQGPVWTEVIATESTRQISDPILHNREYDVNLKKTKSHSSNVWKFEKVRHQNCPRLNFRE